MLDKEVYTILVTFTSYENRDEVRIKTCNELKDSSERIVKNE
jgi:hypothetical protein